MSGRARFTILSMMKDEGASLVEWVAYHRHIGFDRICVYTNDCTDGTDLMLKRMEQLGLVLHFPNEVPPGRKPQPNALGLADENPVVADSDWVLGMDADEFLSVKCGRGQVTDLVAALPEGTDAVAITWRFFGSSGLTDWNPGLVIESYTRAAPNDFRKGWGVKTLFRPFAHMKFGIHRPTVQLPKKYPERVAALAAQRWVNGSGAAMPEDFVLAGWRSTRPTLGYKLVEMNHYAVKSYEAYLLRRIRGNVNLKADKYNANYFAIFDRNELEVRNALRHARATRRLMAEWLADPELARLQAAALDHHRARVARLRSTGEYDAWIKELQLAAEVPYERVDEVLYTQHLPPEGQAKVAALREAGHSDRDIARAIARAQSGRKEAARSGLRAMAAGAETDESADAGAWSGPPHRPSDPPPPHSPSGTEGGGDGGDDGASLLRREGGGSPRKEARMAARAARKADREAADAESAPGKR